MNLLKNIKQTLKDFSKSQNEVARVLHRGIPNNASTKNKDNYTELK